MRITIRKRWENDVHDDNDKTAGHFQLLRMLREIGARQSTWGTKSSGLLDYMRRTERYEGEDVEAVLVTSGLLAPQKTSRG